eukprot:3663651-Heterocapsa_arctica.AAC.1
MNRYSTRVIAPAHSKRTAHGCACAQGVLRIQSVLRAVVRTCCCVFLNLFNCPAYRAGQGGGEFKTQTAAQHRELGA